ncbi:MAG: helix-turn-helix domain-containing protein [Thermodesulfobacteriota bacterium]
MAKDVRIWKPEGLEGVECLRAAWGDVRFERHFHQGYAVGVIESGALGFRYLGRDEVAWAGCVNMAVPGEVHDGHAASPDGWRYRMFYLDADVVERTVRDMGAPGERPPAFPGGVIEDPRLARAIRSLHCALDAGGTTLLERQGRMAGILAAWISRHSETRPAAPAAGTEPAAVRRAREYLRENAVHAVPLSDLAEASGLSGYRLNRVFSRAVGLPPHAYQIRLRVERARELLAAGSAPAAAAIESGFSDQSHLTRHFKRITGFTPAAYGKIVQDA